MFSDTRAALIWARCPQAAARSRWAVARLGPPSGSGESVDRPARPTDRCWRYRAGRRRHRARWNCDPWWPAPARRRPRSAASTQGRRRLAAPGKRGSECRIGWAGCCRWRAGAERRNPPPPLCGRGRRAQRAGGAARPPRNRCADPASSGSGRDGSGIASGRGEAVRHRHIALIPCPGSGRWDCVRSMSASWRTERAAWLSSYSVCARPAVSTPVAVTPDWLLIKERAEAMVASASCRHVAQRGDDLRHLFVGGAGQVLDIAYRAVELVQRVGQLQATSPARRCGW